MQCINPFTEPVRLSAGALVRMYHFIQEADVGPALETVVDTQGKPPRTSRGAVAEHVADMYDGACGNCMSSTKCQALSQLLTEYSDVFSRDDGDMGLTKVISHEIPLSAGTNHIRQPTQSLSPEKEMSRQVQDLPDRDLFEPAHFVWSSPVVLVKKDGS